MLIFAHIGKTGGSTVRSFFNPNLSIAEYHGHQSSIDVDALLSSDIISVHSSNFSFFTAS